MLFLQVEISMFWFWILRFRVIQVDKAEKLRQLEPLLRNFATAGKRVGKKDLAMQAISYGNVYAATVAMGANPQQQHYWQCVKQKLMTGLH